MNVRSWERFRPRNVVCIAGSDLAAYRLPARVRGPVTEGGGAHVDAVRHFASGKQRSCGKTAGTAVKIHDLHAYFAGVYVCIPALHGPLTLLIHTVFCVDVLYLYVRKGVCGRGTGGRARSRPAAADQRRYKRNWIRHAASFFSGRKAARKG